MSSSVTDEGSQSPVKNDQPQQRRPGQSTEDLVKKKAEEITSPGKIDR